VGTVGLFDSGVGGLTVARAIRRRLPGADLLYLGDTARFPYGPRPAAQVEEFTRQGVTFLHAAGASRVVVACNTATVAGLPEAAGASVPVWGVVKAGALPAVRATRNGRVLLLATQLTVDSGAHARLAAEVNPRVVIVGRSAPDLVRLVEEGRLAGEATREAVRAHARAVREAGADTLILGSTHIAALDELFREILGETVTVVDPATELAERLARVESGEGAGSWRLCVTGEPMAFRRAAEAVLGQGLPPPERVRLE
jgi:glutamate racemase